MQGLLAGEKNVSARWGRQHCPVLALHRLASFRPLHPPSTHPSPSIRRLTLHPQQVSGRLDQPNSMLSDDVQEEGYTLLCVATPLADCVIDEITEAEILSKGLKEN